MRSVPVVEGVRTAAYTVPTEQPESDGTLTWSATTVVTVEASAGGCEGLGFTYGPIACKTVVDDLLADVVVGTEATGVPGSWAAMVRSVRNAGRPGVVSMAIAAVDVALWDLQARLLGVPLVRLLGQVRRAVPVYGSGGFTSLSDRALAEQLVSWADEERIPRVKMKVGTDWGASPGRDLDRVRLARSAVGDDVELLVDANGAYTRKQAIRLADDLAEQGVTWFEEPVSSDDLEGLREIRAATSCDVAAGEYGYDLAYFEHLCAAGAVDVVQADVSRCAGITEWLRVAALAAANGLDISGHCAPSLHLHAACATQRCRHLELFADHTRVDRLLFDGVRPATGGALEPDLDRPGLGLDLKRSDAERFRVA